MNWLSIVMKAVPTLITLMRVAEELFDGEPESGKEKKALVMTAIKAIIGGLTGVVLTPELWTKIETAIGFIVDAACVFLFPHEDEG